MDERDIYKEITEEEKEIIANQVLAQANKNKESGMDKKDLDFNINTEVFKVDIKDIL